MKLHQIPIVGPRRSALVWLLISAFLLASCGGGSTTPNTASEPTSASGVRVVSPAEAAAILADPPADLVVLDVRTSDEFAAGHLDGATMIDFYGNDFQNRVAALDPDVPYVLYCRSGNRSGQTRELMGRLGFSDVADIDGGILAWSQAGFTVVG